MDVMTPPISNRARLMPASPIRKLMPLADEAKRRGVHVYHLNIGQPDLETPAPMRSAPPRAARTPCSPTRRRAARPSTWPRPAYYEGLGIPLALEEIIATTGGSEALLFAFLACANEGDEALVVEPFYTNYSAFATMAGVRLVPAHQPRRGRLPPPAARRRGRRPSPRARAWCCSATRTTRPARSTRAEELRMVADFCREHGLFLIADEVYREFVLRRAEGDLSALTFPGCRGLRGRGGQPVQALQRLRHPPRLPGQPQPRGHAGRA